MLKMCQELCSLKMPSMCLASLARQSDKSSEGVQRAICFDGTDSFTCNCSYQCQSIDIVDAIVAVQFVSISR